MSKYGTVEYNLEEIGKQLEKAKESLKLLRDEQGTIVPILNSINFQDDKAHALFFPRSLESWYPNDYSRWGSTFSKDKENHVNSTFKKVEEAYPKVLEAAKTLHELNLPAIENNLKCRKAISDYLANWGLSTTKKVQVKCRKYGYKWESQLCSYPSEIAAQIPTSDGYDSFVSSVHERYRSLKEQHDRYMKDIRAKKEEDEKKVKESKLLAEAIVYCRENKIELAETCPSQDIINAAEDDRRTKWIEKNYPDGTEMSHSACDSCSTWYVGEHRCSCGNRRMEFCVDGSNGNYYAYAQGC